MLRSQQSRKTKKNMHKRDHILGLQVICFLYFSLQSPFISFTKEKICLGRPVRNTRNVPSLALLL